MSKIQDLKVRISADISQFNSQMKTLSSKIQDASKQFEGISKAGEAVSNVGKKLMPLTVAITGVATVSAKTAIEFDSSMNKVSAISGATGKDLDALRAMAKKMGAETKFSAVESADALTFMGMAGWKTQEMLDGLPGILNLASAGGTDLALTSDIVTDGLTALGLKASDTGEFVDIMATACNSSNTSVELMGETLKYAGSTAGALGIEFGDLSVAIGLMANSGIKGSQAGTAIRAGLVNLVKPTKQMKIAMEKYGIAIQKNSDGSVDFMATMTHLRDKLGKLDKTTQASAVATIFGKEAMAGWQAVINATDSDFTKLSDSIANADGTAQKMADTMMQGAGGALVEMKSALEGVAITIGERLTPHIEKFADWISKLCTKFQELSPATQDALIIFGGLLAIIPPILIVVGSLMKGFALLQVASAVLGISVGAVSLAFLAIPLAIVAVVGAIAYVIANWDKVKEKASELGAKIGECWDNIVNWTIEKWNNMWTAISDWWNNLMSSIGEWFAGVVQWFTDGWNQCVDATIEAWNGFTEVLSNVWDTICNLVEFGILLVAEIISAGVQIILLPWNFLWQNCKDFIIPIWEGICSYVGEKLEQIKSYVSEKVEYVSKTFEEKWQAIRAKTYEIYDAIASAVSEKLEKIKAWVSEKLEIVVGFFRDKWEKARNYVVEKVTAIVTYVSEKLEIVKGYVSEKLEAIKNYFGDKFEQAKAKVSDKMEQIKQSIKEKIEVAKSVAGTAIDGIKSKFDIFGTIASNVSNKFNTIKSNITEKINGAKDAVSQAINKIKGFLNITLPFPKLKLPHFSFSGKFSLNPPSVPKFKVDWYNQGAIFKRKTILPGGIGVGDASFGGVGNSPEAILPIKKLPELLGLDKQSNGGISLNIERFENNREQDIEQLANELAFYLKRKKLIGGA